jgi:hypothetical protein
MDLATIQKPFEMARRNVAECESVSANASLIPELERGGRKATQRVSSSAIRGMQQLHIAEWHRPDLNRRRNQSESMPEPGNGTQRVS